jgi:YD repeat-containing protein
MKILKPLFLLISIYGALVGCSKKNDPVAPIPICYPDTYTYVASSYNGIVSTYTYTNNKVATISRRDGFGTTTDTYAYDAQGRINSITNTGGYTTYTQTLTYDSKGRLIEIISSDKVAFTYNSYDQMVRRDYYLNSSYNTPDSYSTYTYPSTNTKNYSTEKKYYGSTNESLKVTITYVYDTKQNPGALLFPTYPQTTNNVTQETFQYVGNSTPRVDTHTYTYNINGFPLTVTENIGGTINTGTYTYTNCK